MYTREFWDDVYRKHFYDAPWMSNSCVRAHISNIEKYLSDFEGKSLLDYGCGNGKLAYHFYKAGATVDLADISDELVEWLKKKYRKHDIGIYNVATPAELRKYGKSYDIVVATSFFHHIEPDLWKDFLLDFSTILKRDGLLVIGGWDETDEVIAEDQNTARFTGQRTWPINTMSSVIEEMEEYDMIVNTLEDLAIDAFPRPRKMRYFVIKNSK